MKIIIITQNEPFFIPILIKTLIKEHHHLISLIVFLKPEEYKNFFKSIWFYLNFWGVNQFFKIMFIYLSKIINNPINPKNVKIIKNININSNKFIKMAKHVDYIISIAANQLFSEELLNSPKKGCINIHSALLPNYRGYNPTFWALYNNEKKTGITIHKMTKKLDDGPIIMQEEINITNDDTWFTVQKKIVKKARIMINELFKLIVHENIENRDLKAQGSLYKKPKIKDGKKFRNNGKKFI